LRVSVDGTPAVGIAADGLPPKWFTKDPQRPIGEEIHEMLRVIENALGLAVGLSGANAYEVWQQLAARQAQWGAAEGLPPLLTQLGTSLVERALIEAVCRASGQPFHRGLREGRLGLPATDLPQTPLSRIVARHTVGLLDPLTEAEIAPADRLDDGLPQSLEACIRAYGLRHFKIKVSGALDRDTDRLRRVAEVLDAHAPADHAFSLDGNEQFHHLADFRAFWDRLTSDPGLASFLGRLMFVEQPLHRDVALRPEEGAELLAWTERPPIIIDESDGTPDAAEVALRHGYAGISHKNCKGTFKSVMNRRMLEEARRRQPGRVFVQSGEDLANIGPVALLQDLAVCTALGIESVERNGHHYFAGLSMWPVEVQEEVLRHHGDLYHRSRDGWPTLRIADGRLAVESLQRAPFGVGFALPIDRFRTPDEWRRAHPL
jgi:hypothetical protein